MIFTNPGIFPMKGQLKKFPHQMDLIPQQILAANLCLIFLPSVAEVWAVWASHLDKASILFSFLNQNIMRNDNITSDQIGRYSTKSIIKTSKPNPNTTLGQPKLIQDIYDNWTLAHSTGPQISLLQFTLIIAKLSLNFNFNFS